MTMWIIVQMEKVTYIDVSFYSSKYDLENDTVKCSTEESKIQTLEPKSERSSTEKENIPNANDPSKMLASKCNFLIFLF